MYNTHRIYLEATFPELGAPYVLLGCLAYTPGLKGFRHCHVLIAVTNMKHQLEFQYLVH